MHCTARKFRTILVFLLMTGDFTDLVWACGPRRRCALCCPAFAPQTTSVLWSGQGVAAPSPANVAALPYQYITRRACSRGQKQDTESLKARQAIQVRATSSVNDTIFNDSMFVSQCISFDVSSRLLYKFNVSIFISYFHF